MKDNMFGIWHLCVHDGVIFNQRFEPKGLKIFLQQAPFELRTISSDEKKSQELRADMKPYGLHFNFRKLRLESQIVEKGGCFAHTLTRGAFRSY